MNGLQRGIAPSVPWNTKHECACLISCFQSHVAGIISNLVISYSSFAENENECRKMQGICNNRFNLITKLCVTSSTLLLKFLAVKTRSHAKLLVYSQFPLFANGGQYQTKNNVKHLTDALCFKAEFPYDLL